MQHESPLRIAIVAPSFFEIPPEGYGGIELMLAQLTDGLVARGHDVTLLGAGRDLTEADFIATYRQAQSHRLGDPLPEIMHSALVGSALEAVDVDIVHDHTLAGPLMAPSRRAPTVVTAHGPMGTEWGEYVRAISAWVSLIAISDSQQRLAPELPWRATVHNAVDADDLVYADIKDDYVLFLGRMNDEKAPHLAIDASRAAGRRILVAGKCSELAEREFFAEHVEPRLGPDVEWLGEVSGDDKRQLLAKAQALVFPIQWDEPFGLVMIEAMGSGTPVVALRRGSVPELVIDGVTGFIRDEPDGLADALREIDRIDPADCRRHVVENFSPEHMVQGYERAFADIVRERRTGHKPAETVSGIPVPTGEELLATVATLQNEDDRRL
jgi:glycosyltransferase involved in cell wall biosynthesis